MRSRISTLIVAALAFAAAPLDPAVAMQARCGEGDGTLIIANVRMIDFRGRNPDVIERATIFVESGGVTRIARKAPSSLPDNAQLIDGSGLTLIPGLHDMHVHIWDESELAANLAHGVTTVRNLSGMPFHLRLAEQVERGEHCGAHLLTSGPILNGDGPNKQINHQLVTSAAGARDAVRAQYGAGFRRIKIYSNLSRAAYDAARDEAKSLGMAVAGHTPEGERRFNNAGAVSFDIDFSELLDDGFETIEHVESVSWHALGDRLDAQAAREVADSLARHKVMVTPTLVAHRNLVNVARSKGAYAARPGSETVPPLVQLIERKSVARWAQENPDFEERKAAFYSRFTDLLDARGVRLVAGSDAGIFVNFHGQSLLDELDLLVEAGLTPYSAIRAATANAAETLGTKGKTGCAGAGCAADFLLLRCDPLSDIQCVRDQAAVIFRGRYISSADMNAPGGLYAAARAHDNDRLIANLLAGLAAQGVTATPDELFRAIEGQ
ncbi:MAG: amidohydrolase family protein [Parvularculaceae bacterium]